MKERKFLLPYNRGEIRLTKEVLEHIYSYSQNKIVKTEAGGQLFSLNPEEHSVTINKATGPYLVDKRTRCSFKPNIKRANKDRERLLPKGLYAVGLWHTHPEAVPIVSSIDQETTIECLKGFNGEMEGFLQIIIGNKGTPLNMGVWVALKDEKEKWLQLEEII